MLAMKPPNWLRGYGVLPAVLSGPAQAFSELGVIEPGGERPGEPAGPEQAGVAAGYQVTERNEADQPALHLPGVGLDRQVDVVSGVVFAHGDRAALDVQPAFGSARAGQPQVQHGALPRELGRDRLLVQIPHHRQAVAVLLSGVTEDPLGGPVPDGPDDRGQRFPGRCQCVTPGPATGAWLAADEPAPLEQPQPLREQGPADPGNSPVDLVESARADHEFADDQWRPPVPQHLDSGGDWAVVRVASHVPMMPGPRGPWVVRI